MNALSDDSALVGDPTLGDRSSAMAHQSQSEARPVRHKSRAKASILEKLVLVALAIALALVTTIVDWREHWRRS